MTFFLKRVFIACCLLSGLSLKAGDTYSEVDQKSYTMYMNKEWKQLLAYGKKALKEGTDYYYLRMRVGIAAYELKNYYAAEPHFAKALMFNEGDELAQEYLYYCYVFTQRFEEAGRLSKSFSNELKQRLGITKKTIDFVTLEGGSKLPDSATYVSKITGAATNNVDPAIYAQIGLGHTLNNRFSLFHAVTYYGQLSYMGDLKQYQYYLKSVIPFNNGWQLIPAIHYLHQNLTTETKAAPPPPGMRPSPSTITATSSDVFAGALNVRKRIQNWQLGVGSVFTNMLNKSLVLNNTSVHYAPFGNEKLVVGATAYVHTSDSYVTTNVSVLGNLQLQPHSRVLLNLSYLHNAGQNIIEDNAYHVNNAFDLTTSRIGFLGSFRVTNKWSLYGTYQLENKLESFSFYNYYYHIVVGGVKYVF